MKHVDAMLLVLFVGLKLTGYIDWSWWWVTAPAWVPLVIFLVGAVVIALYQLGCAVVTNIRTKGKGNTNEPKSSV